MEQIVLDTNIFLRDILRYVENQYLISKNFFTKAKSKSIHLIIPQIVIFEIVFNLDKYYGFEKSKIVKVVKDLLLTSALDVQDNDIFNVAVDIYENNSIDFVDSFIIAKAQISNAKIFSFDKDFDKLTKTKT